MQGHQVNLVHVAAELVPAMNLPTPTAVSAPYSRPDFSPSLNEIVTGLLPTPRTTDANGAGRHGDGGPDLRTVATEELLPTPMASDNGGPLKHKGGNPTLSGALDLLDLLPNEPLLPTPMAMIEDSKSTAHRHSYGHGNYFSDLPHLLGMMDDQELILPTPAASDAVSDAGQQRMAEAGDQGRGYESNLVGWTMSQAEGYGGNRESLVHAQRFTRMSTPTKPESTSERTPDLFDDGS